MVPRFGLLLVGLSVLALLILAPALGGPFLWDDAYLIPNNPSIQSFQHWGDWFRRSMFAGSFDVATDAGRLHYWRPAILFTLASEWHFAVNNPVIHHVTNLLLYASLVLLVGVTLLRYTRNATAALVGTAWFALHPTHVECAAWISGRMDLLVTLAILLTCLGRHLRMRHGRAFVVVELFGTLLAYTSKETAVLLPLFVAVEVWHLAGCPPLDRHTLLRLSKTVIPHLLLALGYILARLRWLPFSDATQSSAQALGPIGRSLVVCETVGRAVALTFWPYPQRAQHGLLAIDPSGAVEHGYGYVSIGAIAIAVLIASGVQIRRRSPAVLVAIALSVVTFLPTSNVVPGLFLSCHLFERYLLLCHFGAAYALAIWVFGFSRQPSAGGTPRRVMAATLGIALCVAFISKTYLRAEDYADASRFWQHELEVNPRSSVAPAELAKLTSDPSVAMECLERCYANAVARGQTDSADPCLLAAAEKLQFSLKDAQTVELRQLIGGFASLLNGTRANAAEVAPNQAALERIIGMLSQAGPRRHRVAKTQPGRIESDVAWIASRLGDHALAVEYAARSIARCDKCRWTVALSTVYAAAGQHERARDILAKIGSSTPDVQRTAAQVEESERHFNSAKTLAGPAQIHALAQNYLSIGRYGLALNTLAPYEGEIARVEEASRDYAMVAWRAGRVDLAKKILAIHSDPKTVDSILAGWRDGQGE